MNLAWQQFDVPIENYSRLKSQNNGRIPCGTKTPTCVTMESIATSVDKLPTKSMSRPNYLYVGMP
ncbi:MAG TPA: hypothetical protein VIS48_06910 [Candidatus Kryptonia bacterium]